MIYVYMEYILTIDQGTTSTKSTIYDTYRNIISISRCRINQLYPENGWVEQLPEEIWGSVIKSIKNSMRIAKIDFKSIRSIGITNQRESILLWDKNTGKPVYSIISWQDRRKNDLNKFKEYFDIIKNKTGLPPNAYFSLPKILWILKKIKNKNIDNLFAGTIDSWIIWKLTGGKIHATDYTNASRTMLFNIHTLNWDSDLIDIFKVPENILPDVYPSGHGFGYTNIKFMGKPVEINAVMGDQNSSMLGQNINAGDIKNTYGTGSFIMANTGKEIKKSCRLISTVGYSVSKNDVYYALEGSIMNSGSVFEWLNSAIKIKNTENFNIYNYKNDVYFVPAFSGLGSPYWDDSARGLIIGITRETKPEDIFSAGIMSIAFQTADVINEIKKIFNVNKMKVDGAGSKNDYLMKFQSDILNIKIFRSENTENTSSGIYYLSGIKSDLWNINDIKNFWKYDYTFYPSIDENARNKLYKRWNKAVKRSMKWL